MATTTRTPPELLRAVPFDFLAANQAVAALEDRISWLRLHEDTAPEAAAAHRAVVALREAFGIPAMSEAALDAAHEASVAEFAELADAEASDAPLAVRP